MKLPKDVREYMNKYEIKISWDDNDKIYVAKVTELPNCMSHGKTKAEAFRMIEEAMEGHLLTLLDYNETIPRPKSSLKKTGKIPLRINSELHTEIALKADDYDVSINKFIEAVLRKHIEDEDAIDRSSFLK